MATLPQIREPYQISPRAMQAKALALEVDALSDELHALTMKDPDQVRRQLLLVHAQRQEAERLRGFLTATRAHSMEQVAKEA